MIMIFQRMKDKSSIIYDDFVDIIIDELRLLIPIVLTTLGLGLILNLSNTLIMPSLKQDCKKYLNIDLEYHQTNTKNNDSNSDDFIYYLNLLNILNNLPK